MEPEVKERFADLINNLDAFLRRHSDKPMKVYYFAYPYSSAPIPNAVEVSAKVRHILEKRKDIVPIVPHWAFDALYNFPTGYSHPEMAHWEVEIISRCDAVVFEPSVTEKAQKEKNKGGYSGVIWEVAIAQKFGTNVWTYDEVEKGVDLEVKK